MHQKDEEKEASGLQAALATLRDHIVARAKASAKLLQSYLDLGGSLADFTEYGDSLRAMGVKQPLRVIDGGKSDEAAAAPAPSKRGRKKGGKKAAAARKAPPRPEAKGKSAKGDLATKVLEVLSKAGQPMAVSDVAKAAGISGKDAAIALKQLREHKKAKSQGKARGTRWSAK